MQSFDNATVSSPFSSSPATVSHVTTSSSNRQMWVHISYSGTINSISGVTYNGVAMTKVVGYAGNAGNNEIWGLSNPSSGTNTVSVSWSSGVSSGIFSVVTYSGVKQTAQPEGYSTATLGGGPGVSIDGSITTLADNCFVVGFANYSTASQNLNAGTATTERISVAGGALNNSIGVFDNGTPKTPAGSVTLQAVVSGGTGLMDIVCLSQEPIFPSSGAFIPYFY